MTHLERILAQCATKQFVAQPHLISANYVGLTVVGDLFDLALAEIALHFITIEPLGLSRQSQDFANLVKSGLSLRAKRREHVTQIDGVLAVPVEVGARRKARRG